MDNNSMFGAQDPPEEKPKVSASAGKRLQQSKRGEDNPNSQKSIIDWDTVKKLCAIFCTQREIAGFLGVHHNTLENRVLIDGLASNWKEFYERASAGGKLSLRRKQFQQAMDGDKTMLIWLGKQYLGQVDRNHVVSEYEDKPLDSYDLGLVSSQDLDKMQEILSAAQSVEIIE